jgi:hypothetical protein
MAATGIRARQYKGAPERGSKTYNRHIDEDVTTRLRLESIESDVAGLVFSRIFLDQHELGNATKKCDPSDLIPVFRTLRIRRQHPRPVICGRRKRNIVASNAYRAYRDCEEGKFRLGT